MKRQFLLGVLAFWIGSAAVEAQTRYVSDELVITFRTGPGSQFAITKNLVSGNRVEVLEELPDEGFTHVRLSDGTEGWVLTQYLQAEPTAGIRLAAAERELGVERQRADELARQLSELETNLASTSEALNASQSNEEEISAELASIRSASANALQTRQQNDQLRRQVDELSSSAQVAAMEIDELRRRERQNWFIIGAAVLLGGVIIGLVAPSLRPKRRSSW
jgi:SH3 domain protein